MLFTEFYQKIDILWFLFHFSMKVDMFLQITSSLIKLESNFSSKADYMNFI